MGGTPSKQLPTLASDSLSTLTKLLHLSVSQVKLLEFWFNSNVKDGVLTKEDIETLLRTKKAIDAKKMSNITWDALKLIENELLAEQSASDSPVSVATGSSEVTSPRAIGLSTESLPFLELDENESDDNSGSGDGDGSGSGDGSDSEEPPVESGEFVSKFDGTNFELFDFVFLFGLVNPVDCEQLHQREKMEENLLRFVFYLLAENNTTMTRWSVLKVMEMCGKSTDESANSTVDFLARHCNSGSGSPSRNFQMTFPMFHALFKDRDVLSKHLANLKDCFGFIPFLKSRAFKHAMQLGDIPVSVFGALKKENRNHSWSLRYAYIHNGFFWYSPRLSRADKTAIQNKSYLRDPKPATGVCKIVPLEDIRVVCRDPIYPNGAPAKTQKKEVNPFDSPVLGPKVARGSIMYPFKVYAGSWSKKFACFSETEREQWMAALIKSSRYSDNSPYDSYSPHRKNVHARYFVDGQEYFGALRTAIESAKQDIFITGWMLSPAIYLRRDRHSTILDRLDILLEQKANEGVKIYILCWNETKVAFNLGSLYAQNFLGKRHPNIFMVRHPASFPLYWSHHQKIVVVDQRTAFIGGMDLAHGRYDTPIHRLDDSCELSLTWPGFDYYNPEKAPMINDPNMNAQPLDRLKIPRMPWHDISCVLFDDAALDVAWSFIQRWNHHICDLQITGTTPFLLPSGYENAYAIDASVSVKSISAEKSTPCAYFNAVSRSSSVDPEPPVLWEHTSYLVNADLVRSSCLWSGAYRRETSVEEAMYQGIRNARNFIYIENQYFVSLMTEGRHNRVAKALVERICEAVEKDQDFFALILIPSHPDGKVSSPNISYIMYYEYKSICRARYSIFQRLQQRHPEVPDWSKYIYFGSLRQWGTLVPARDAPAVHNMIYIHSKLTIIDDELCIIGSANINDRSLNGTRDSEIAVVITPPSRHADESEARNVRFAKDLRIRLMEEHLCTGRFAIEPRMHEDISVETFDRALFEKIKQICTDNTRHFVHIFGNSVPTNDIRKLADFNYHSFTQLESISAVDAKEYLTANVIGHLVEHPLHFLEDENLTPILSSSSVLEDKVFQ